MCIDPCVGRRQSEGVCVCMCTHWHANYTRSHSAIDVTSMCWTTAVWRCSCLYVYRSMCWTTAVWRCSVVTRRTTPTSIQTLCDECRQWWAACSSLWHQLWSTARQWRGTDSRTVSCRFRNSANVNARSLQRWVLRSIHWCRPGIQYFFFTIFRGVCVMPSINSLLTYYECLGLNYDLYCKHCKQ